MQFACCWDAKQPPTPTPPLPIPPPKKHKQTNTKQSNNNSKTTAFLQHRAAVWRSRQVTAPQGAPQRRDMAARGGSRTATAPVVGLEDIHCPSSCYEIRRWMSLAMECQKAEDIDLTQLARCVSSRDSLLLL